MNILLIVDDHAEIRALMRDTLEQDGLEIIEAGEARSGLELVQSRHPQVVLMDIMMPGEMDGLELCRRIKSDPATRATKVVMVSARGHRNDVHIGRDAGADDYLLKPFSPLRLQETVERLLAPA
ncbi:MAG: response regulator [Burkholderiales bacterium]|nr:response regulator [Burkholderiales bacterium]MDE2457139.1 response regulator [Burkholderiales bacterium]